MYNQPTLKDLWIESKNKIQLDAVYKKKNLKKKSNKNPKRMNKYLLGKCRISLGVPKLTPEKKERKIKWNHLEEWNFNI